MCGFYNQNLVLFSRHLEAEFFKKSKWKLVKSLCCLSWFSSKKNPESENFRFNPKISDISSDFFHLRTSPRKKPRQIVECCFFLLLYWKLNPKKSDYFRLFPNFSNSTARNSTFFYWPVAISRVFCFYLVTKIDFFCNNFQIFFSSNYSTTLLNKSFSF